MPSHLPYSHHERALTKGTALDRSMNTPFGRSDHFQPEMRPVEYVDQKLKEAYKFHNVEPDWGLEKEVVFLERRPYAAALLDCAEKAVKAAGTLISAAYAKKSKPCFETKSNPTDPVTDLDQRCEDLIVMMIKERYSGHAIIGEESSANDVDLRSAMTEDPTWIIDPLDGTTNYVHGIPTCAVSVGVYVCNSPVAAAVYFPLTDELFSATIRGGAFLNGSRIRTSGCASLSAACVATDSGYDRTEQGVAHQMQNIQKVLVAGKTQAIRISGSCCSNLCMLACGRMDAYFEGRNSTYGPKPWDLAAGALILQEAGGWIGGFDGSELDIFSGRAAAAASEELRDELLELID